MRCIFIMSWELKGHEGEKHAKYRQNVINKNNHDESHGIKKAMKGKGSRLFC